MKIPHKSVVGYERRSGTDFPIMAWFVRSGRAWHVQTICNGVCITNRKVSSISDAIQLVCDLAVRGLEQQIARLGMSHSSVGPVKAVVVEVALRDGEFLARFYGDQATATLSTQRAFTLLRALETNCGPETFWRALAGAEKGSMS